MEFWNHEGEYVVKSFSEKYSVKVTFTPGDRKVVIQTLSKDSIINSIVLPLSKEEEHEYILRD